MLLNPPPLPSPHYGNMRLRRRRFIAEPQAPPHRARTVAELRAEMSEAGRVLTSRCLNHQIIAKSTTETMRECQPTSPAPRLQREQAPVLLDLEAYAPKKEREEKKKRVSPMCKPAVF
jgi:hypothetical protein